MKYLSCYLAGLATIPVGVLIWGAWFDWRLKRRFPEHHRNGKRRHFPEYLDR